jgi:hypothetical protein
MTAAKVLEPSACPERSEVEGQRWNDLNDLIALNGVRKVRRS